MKRISCRFPAFLLVILASGVEAATWQVETDGSGDFTTLQEAADAASSGDTILIGPGRYQDTREYRLGAERIPINMIVSVENLKIVGAEDGSTFIGPDAPLPPTQNWGLYITDDGAGVSISNLHFTGVHIGIFATAQAVVSDCSFHCRFGLSVQVYPSAVTDVSRCRFWACYKGVYKSQGELAVRDCEFENNQFGIDVASPTLAGPKSVLVERCEFVNNVQRSVRGTSAEVEIVGCSFDGGNQTIVSAFYGSAFELRSNTFTGGDIQLSVSWDSSCEAASNTFEGSTEAAIEFDRRSTGTISDNNIIPATGWSVRCENYTELPPILLDFTHNYWGSSDATMIEATILDGNDDSQLKVIVGYEPYRQQQVSSPTSSIGSLKAHFGRKPRASNE